MEKLDFRSLNEKLLERTQELLPKWLPRGKFTNGDKVYRCDNLTGGGSGSLSLSINLEDNGCFYDHANPEVRGGDLIALYATIKNIKQGKAYKELIAEIEIAPTKTKDKKMKFETSKSEKKANEIWKRSIPVTTHPYLEKKKIKEYNVRVYKNYLAIPLYYNKKIVSLQLIDQNGGKKFLSGGRVKDCYFRIGKVERENVTLCLAEGYATGASIHEATGFPVLVAFNCNNLESVAKITKKEYPNANIIICGDDDFNTENNPGKLKANNAALVAEAKVAIPKFDENRPEWAKDFNDMAVFHSHDLVRQAILNASYPKWPNPLTLSEDYPEAEFPLDMFPEKIRLAIKEVACFVKAPMPLVASSHWELCHWQYRLT